MKGDVSPYRTFEIRLFYLMVCLVSACLIKSNVNFDQNISQYLTRTVLNIW